MIAPAYLKSEEDYRRTLRWWASHTQSRAESAWRGPGTYRFSGYHSDEGAPVATLEKTR